MGTTDEDLLQRYVQGSQEAFAELVSRHLDLVYSAARRQASASHLAEEITQSVFISLSRSAATLKTGTPLAAWLHLATRHAAIDAARRESRRQAREQAAMEISAMNSTPSVWSQVEPLLDEAVTSLPEPDRNAILLRYFENQSLREVGQSLGTSEDAAQKRVSRAVDQLRTFFLKRGVAITAADLATDISANAIQTAPVTLGTSISATTAALGTAAGHAILSETVKTVAMTTLQKTALTALALVVGAGIYEARIIYRQHDDLQNQREHVEHLHADVTGLQQQRTAATRQTALVQRQIEALQASAAETKVVGDPVLEAEMRAWYARLDQIKQAFEQSPQLKIPELVFLTDKDWFSAAQATKLDTPDQVREALGSLRSTAKSQFGRLMLEAMQAYVTAHDQFLPDNSSQLQPYFKVPIDSTILERYEMFRTGTARDLPNNSAGMVMRERDAVDLEYDTHWEFGVTGMVSTPALSNGVKQAQKNYAAANSGQLATDPMQLMPYLKAAVNPSKLLPYLKP